jgi:tetratricopeptide (TPR) repeat protein
MRQLCDRVPLFPGYVAALLAVEAVLVVLHFAFPSVGLVDLDREHNLPSWFSGLQLAAIGVACGAAFHGEGPGRRLRGVWALLAAGFFYLSFDEISVLHESILREETLEALPGASLLRGLPPWQLVFAPAAAGAALTLGYVFVSRLWTTPLARAAALAGVALWGGAFMFEGTAIAVAIPQDWYRVEVALEEFCEMAGATMLLAAILAYVVAPGREARANAADVIPRIRWAYGIPALLLLAVPGLVIATVIFFGRGPVRVSAGERLLDDGRYGAAVEAFSAAVDESPDDLRALRGLATAAYRAGDLPLAERTFERALTLAPEDESIRNGLDLLRAKRAIATP